MIKFYYLQSMRVYKQSVRVDEGESNIAVHNSNILKSTISLQSNMQSIINLKSNNKHIIKNGSKIQALRCKSNNVTNYIKILGKVMNNFEEYKVIFIYLAT